VGAVVLLLQGRQDRPDRLPDVADEPQVHTGPPADLLAPQVHLDDLRLLGEELRVREVGPEHQQGVARHHRPVPGREPEQPRHAHVVRVVRLDELLAPHRMDDRGLEPPGQCNQVGVCPGAPGPAEDRDLGRGVQQSREFGDLGVGRADHGNGPARGDPRGRELGRLGGHVARQHDHGDAAPLDRGADRDVEDAGHLLGVGDGLAVVAALAEQRLRARLLEVPGPDLLARDLGRDGDHRHAAAVAVVQAVDEVQVARPAAPGARGQFAGQVGFGPRRERGRLLVPDVDPADVLALADRVGDPVQGVPG
jgi:hypothetical protein